MAKARREEPDLRGGAARLIAAVCLAVVLALGLRMPHAPPPAADGHGESEIAGFDAPLSPVAPASWNVRQNAPLFGLATEPVAGQVAAKWRAVQADLETQLDALARCRAGEACSGPARALVRIVGEGVDHDGVARIGLINRAVDLLIAPTSDEAQWGVADHWSSPFETLATGKGDCEDYAILKYAALLAAGVSRDDVKIVILHNVAPDEDHAVAAVRLDDGWRILDDSKLALVRDIDLAGARPRFVLDQDGARRFVAAAGRPEPNLSRNNAARLMRPV